MYASRLTSTARTLESPSDEEIHLRELNHTKDRLLGLVTHDLRSAVGCFGSLIEMLEEQLERGDCGEAARITGIMRRSAGDADEILNDLVTWMRGQGQENAFHLEPIQIRSLVEGEMQRLAPVAARKDIRMECEAESGVELRGDGYMLRVVLRNLLSNAIKYSHPGGTVCVAVDRLEREWRVRVIDQGIGMSAKVQERLLKVDHLKKIPGTAGESGSGMGLLLCEEYVQRHGGRISWESEPNRGSTFTVLIPDLLG